MKAGLTPAAIVVGSIALGVMCIGIAATIYYSIILPRMARKKQRQAQIDQTPPASYSPYLDQNAGELTTPPLAGEKSLYAAMFVKEGDSREMSLSPPVPAYAADKRERFSTATHEGIWWVV